MLACQLAKQLQYAALHIFSSSPGQTGLIILEIPRILGKPLSFSQAIFNFMLT
jgi:hypothetical protein